MVAPTTTITPETDDLNREIAKKSNGVCLLSFSGGKDSVCAWLVLRNYFSRIIPMHFASVPGLKSKERMLRYYEDAFETHILRMVGEEVSMALPRMMYQLPDEAPALAELETPDWSKLDAYEFVRKTLNLPKAWCAIGISEGDSIDRRIYCKKTGGKNPQNLTFYPHYNFTRAQVILTIRNSGLKLSDEYLWQNRSLGGVPSYTCNKLYQEHYPEDFERWKAVYPLLLAKSYREMMLDAIWERRKAAGIISDDDEPSPDEAFDDGTDVMAELGMGLENEQPDQTGEE